MNSSPTTPRARLSVGRIPYVNTYPVYGAIDRGIVPLDADLVDGVPTALNALMAAGALDVSVVSAVEYARDHARYLLLPDLAISCDGPVRSVLLFSDRPASELDGQPVAVSRSSMTSIELLRLLFRHVWRSAPTFVPRDAEAADLADADLSGEPARLVIGDAALILRERARTGRSRNLAYVYDLGLEWKRWTGLPFVFAVWVAQRAMAPAAALGTHATLIESRNWGLAHLDALATQACARTGVAHAVCLEYLSGLDYGLGLPHVQGLTEFFRKLSEAGQAAPHALEFLAVAS